MATWEDGPEYAPVERPAAFAQPAVGIGLETPPPSPPPPVLPAEQPAFAGPERPVPQLADLVPEPPAGRDPKQPFDVASSVMTADSSAWAAAHGAAPQPGSAPPPTPQAPIAVTPSQRGGGPTTYGSGPTVAAPSNGHHAPAPGYPAPAGPAVFPPTSGPPSYPPPGGAPGQPSFPYGTTPNPFPPPAGPPTTGPFPAPGTTQWFGPGAHQQQPLRPTAPDARAVLGAATPGMLVTLLVGALIWILAPITLVLAFVLSRRMTYGRKAIQTAFAAVLAFLGLVGLVAIFTADGVFSDWWGTVARWGCFGSWVMLVLTAVLVYRALKRGVPDPPPAPRSTLR